METFSSDWLQLREPLDHAARADTLLALLQAHQLPGPAESKPLQVLDLGAGSGSNLRYLGPRIQGPQQWLLIDHDPELLAQISAPRTDIEIDCRQEDLNTWIRRGDAGQPDLVTGSALLDLVSAEWLDQLRNCCTAWGSAVLFALTVNERLHIAPKDPDDAIILQNFLQHQVRDKGFGPALGPTATHVLANRLQADGYRVYREPSSWHLSAGEKDLVAELLTGWMSAAIEQDPDQQDRFRSWWERRMVSVQRGEIVLEVGHWDLLALP